MVESFSNSFSWFILSKALERVKSTSAVIFFAIHGFKDVVCKEYIQSLRRVRFFVPALMRCK